MTTSLVAIIKLVDKISGHMYPVRFKLGSIPINIMDEQLDHLLTSVKVYLGEFWKIVVKIDQRKISQYQLVNIPHTIEHYLHDIADIPRYVSNNAEFDILGCTLICCDII